jgi:hypothetical protein
MSIASPITLFSVQHLSLRLVSRTLVLWTTSPLDATICVIRLASLCILVVTVIQIDHSNLEDHGPKDDREEYGRNRGILP